MILDVLMTLFTAGSAAGAFFAARSTKQAAQAQVLLELSRDYSAPDMSEALRTLRRWHGQHGEGFASEWSRGMAAGDPQAQAVDRARRRVSSYFQDADELRQARLISKGTLRSVANKAGLAVLLVICSRLERELDPKVSLAFMRRLRKLCPERQQLMATIPIGTGEQEP